jgi:hypothetical protein
MLAPGYNARQLQQLKVYIAHLFVSRVTVYMSFLPAEWRSSGASIADYNTGELPCPPSNTSPNSSHSDTCVSQLIQVNGVALKTAVISKLSRVITGRCVGID